MLSCIDKFAYETAHKKYGLQPLQNIKRMYKYDINLF